MAFIWPPAVRFVDQGWTVSSGSTTGGRTATGFQQVVRTDFGFWRMQGSLAVHDEDAHLGYLALLAQLGGMGGEVDVPVINKWRPYDMNGSMLSHEDAISVGGRSLFHHGMWAKTEDDFMSVYGNAARGSTRMAIRHPHIQGLRPGHSFGIGHRHYRVASAWQISYEEAGLGGNPVFDGADNVLDGLDQVIDGLTAGERLGENIQVIDFWPRLREAAPSGTNLILGRPVCRMRLTSDEGGSFSQSETDIGRPTVEFEEAI